MDVTRTLPAVYTRHGQLLLEPSSCASTLIFITVSLFGTFGHFLVNFGFIFLLAERQPRGGGGGRSKVDDERKRNE